MKMNQVKYGFKLKYSWLNPLLNVFFQDMYPSNKLEKKLEKFMNNLICKLKRPEAEFVFEYCLTEIIKNDNPKVLSNHGNRIFIQLLIKANQNILMSNLMKVKNQDFLSFKLNLF